MGRGPKPTKGKAKSAVSRQSPKNEDSRVRDLEKRLAEALGQLQTRNRELAESQEQQTATAEILRVISASPTDIQPIFDAVAATASRLCEAFDVEIFRRNGDQLLLVAHHGPLPSRSLIVPLVRETFNGRAVLDGRTLHVADLPGEADEFPVGSKIAREHGSRAQLGVPLMREGVAIGTISLRRTEARLFTERQIALLQTFADQAVIAIENVRLFTELQEKNRALTQAHAQVSETLEQQTATSEVLKVISRAAFDLQPVLQALVDNATRLCDAQSGVIWRFDGEVFRLAAERGVSPELKDSWARYPFGIGRGSATGRTALEGRTVHIPDVLADPEYTLTDAQKAGGFRTILGVPMLRDGVLVGVFGLQRYKVRPFTDRQVELVTTFADQAAIAIENVRLFTELQEKNRSLTQAHAQVSESLEQQTATSEILRVISRSPTDVKPVFDTIVQSGARLCNAVHAVVVLTDGITMNVPANYGRSSPEALAAARAMWPRPLDMTTTAGAAILTRSVVQIQDTEDPSASDIVRQAGRLLGYRSSLAVPMLRGVEAIGAIRVARQEPNRFSDAEVKLLKTFADQAVIAIENVRLFTELQQKNEALTQAHAQVTEALEQQTATSEILRVISSSPTDIQPVFDAIASSAAQLCRTYDVFIRRLDEDGLRLVAHHGPIAAAPLVSVGRGLVSGLAVLERRTIHIVDVQAAAAELPEAATLGQMFGHRTNLGVPLLREGVPLGVIVLRRAETKPFTDQEIALLQTFANQAVIAIENVRLFKELQTSNRELTTALDKQTATSDILSVISRSQTNVQPVFDAIVNSAVRLLRGYSALVTRVAGDQIELAAYTSTGAEGDAAARAFYPMPLETRNAHGQTIHARRTLNIADAQTDARLPEASHAFSRARGLHGLVVLPLRRHDEALGAIGVSRRELGEFTDDEIALLQTFADQAVIAIENVRLFTELEVRNKALTQSLEQQTATAEILQVISRSPTDIQPVFQAIVDSAQRLLRGNSSVMSRIIDDRIELAAYTRTGPTADALLESFFPIPLRPSSPDARPIREGVIGRRVPYNVADTETDPRVGDRGRTNARARGYRSQLVVPMLRQDEAVGTIAVTRAEPGAFTDDEIALLKTFADQAVIAIENVRLFKELQTRNTDLTDALSRQTATSEILRVISGSPTDVQPVFDTIVKSAVTLCNGVFGSLDRFDGDLIYPVATHNYTREALDAVHRMFPARPSRSLGVGRAILDRAVVHIPDVELDPEYRAHHLAGAIGFRSGLFVPMLRDGVPIGAILVARAEAGPFSDNEIALLKTFADQAVIAIENVRLFHELEAANRELSAASQHKSEFLANMSHELRTPLNAIIGFSEVLSEKMFGELNEKQEEYSKDIHASGQHLLSLINDILDLSKIEAGRMELELSDFHLPTALDSALTLVRERAGRRSIALHLSVDERLGQIQGDERKVRQVVLNLLSNAIKFTPEGGRIEVRATPREGLVEISVTDTGVGIAPEDQEAVFEEFRQVGTADKKVEGTGLGLTLCRKFIELHGGKIWVKSELGVGSTFTFTIPAGK